jgi:hypothetical protein
LNSPASDETRANHRCSALAYCGQDSVPLDIEAFAKLEQKLGRKELFRRFWACGSELGNRRGIDLLKFVSGYAPSSLA